MTPFVLLNRKQPQSQFPTSLPPSKSLRAPPHLPFDLVVEILCRLSVKHLFQLRCVCKSWNSLISEDPEFSKKHIRLSTSNHERHYLIEIPPHSSKAFVLCHYPISSIFSSASASASTTIVEQFRYSIRETPIRGACGSGVSACDGIICFKIDQHLVVLCNPSIRKFKILPPLKFPDQLFTLYTLVYDRFINTYKVIALNTKEVNVHTLGTDYWRRIQDFPAPLVLPTSGISGIFMSDTVNWLPRANDGYAQFIVSLDLEKESYQKLSLPVFDVSTSFMTLGTLKGCLSHLYFRRDYFSDIWIMKEFGNEKSWIKLFTVPHMKECAVVQVFPYARALYISKDDQVLMEFIKNWNFYLVVYDSITNTFKIPKFPNKIRGKMMGQEIYVESLISPL